MRYMDRIDRRDPVTNDDSPGTPLRRIKGDLVLGIGWTFQQVIIRILIVDCVRGF